MAITRRDQFTRLEAGDAITSRIRCKRIYIADVAPAAAAQTDLDITDGGGSNVLFTVSIPGDDMAQIEGPFNLEGGITCPTNCAITLVH